VLAALIVLKVTASVVMGYREYFPPNFAVDFLLGRESYFFGSYRPAFYAHILAGPITLLLGLLLVSERFRLRFPKGHRTLGKLQGAFILLLLAPSGLWMAKYAQTGAVAGVGFGLLAMATGGCVILGWRAAVRRRFDEHRRWMWRCFLLLCSAIVLRLIGGFVEVTGVGEDYAYPLAAWVSWLFPLVVFEVRERLSARRRFSVIVRSSHGAFGDLHVVAYDRN
jgi:hypothetical protein